MARRRARRARRAETPASTAGDAARKAASARTALRTGVVEASGRARRSLATAGKAVRPAASILRPPTPVVVVAPFCIAAMMAWVFVLGNEGSMLSYVFYALSFYLLTVLCVGVFGGRSLERAKAFVCRHRLAKRVLEDGRFRLRLFISASIVVNAFWAIVNLTLGASTASPWFVTMGCYYLLFGAVRGMLLARLLQRARIEAGAGTDADGMGREAGAGDAFQTDDGRLLGKKACRTVRTCGLVMLSSTFVFSGVVTLLLHGDATIRYDEVTTISLAAFTFYSLVSAIVGFVRTRGSDDILLATNRRVSLSIALVSLFTLEMAMLATFGTGDDAALTFALPVATGSAVALALCWLGASTVQKANRMLP